MTEILPAVLVLTSAADWKPGYSARTTYIIVYLDKLLLNSCLLGEGGHKLLSGT